MINKAMSRLLDTGLERGSVQVDYHQQWKTWLRALELGYIEEDKRWYRVSKKGEKALKEYGLKKTELRREWDTILSVYSDLNWQGKSVSRKRMIEIKKLLSDK